MFAGAPQSLGAADAIRGGMSSAWATFCRRAASGDKTLSCAASGIAIIRIHLPSSEALRPDSITARSHCGSTIMPTKPGVNTSAEENASLVAELEKAEAYEQRLRQLISDARDQLAAGNTAVALSLLNAALSDIDAATDVVAASPKQD
jgi:hypothetical protein